MPDWVVLENKLVLKFSWNYSVWKTNLNHSTSTGPVVVQKLVNTNPGSRVNQSSNFAI